MVFFRVWKKQNDINIIEKDLESLGFVQDCGIELNVDIKGHKSTIFLFGSCFDLFK